MFVIMKDVERYISQRLGYVPFLFPLVFVFSSFFSFSCICSMYLGNAFFIINKMLLVKRIPCFSQFVSNKFFLKIEVLN